MSAYELQVVSVDGLEFDGEVQRVTLRTIDGDVAILARHTNYCTAVGMGTVKVILPDNTERRAACIGGMISVMNGKCRILPTTWEWSSEIDVERAERARDRAKEKLADATLSREARAHAQAKLYRALVRLQSAGK